MALDKSISLSAVEGGKGQKVVIGAASSGSDAAAGFPDTVGFWFIYVDNFCFMRVGPAGVNGAGGATPTAVVDVDVPLAANNAYRVGPIYKGQRIAFFSTAGGNAWLYPQA